MSVVMVTKRNHTTDMWQWQVENLHLQLNFDATRPSVVSQTKSDIFKAGQGTCNESHWKIILNVAESYDLISKKNMPRKFQVGLEFLGTHDSDSNDETSKINSIEKATARYEIKLMGDEGEFFKVSDNTTFYLRRNPSGHCLPDQQSAIRFLDVMPFHEISARRGVLFSEDKLNVHVTLTQIFDNVHTQQTQRPTITSICSIENLSRKTNTLGHSLGRLLGQQQLSDVQLLCCGQTFFAHRNILSARSPYFCTMLMIAPAVKQFKMDDMNVPTLQRMLKYIYTDDDNVDNLIDDLADDSYQDLIELLECADKYHLVNLKSSCLDKICALLNDDNVAKIAMIAYKCNAGSEWVSIIQDYCLRRHGILMKNSSYRASICKNPDAFIGNVGVTGDVGFTGDVAFIGDIKRD